VFPVVPTVTMPMKKVVIRFFDCFMDISEEIPFVYKKYLVYSITICKTECGKFSVCIVRSRIIMSRKVVFNADDFGLSAGVSRGIIHSCKNGVVRSTSVMVNMPGIEDCVEILKTCPELDTGIHVNLTFGPPVSEAETIPSLAGSNGLFSVKPGRISEEVDPDDLHREIIAQVRRAYELDLNPSHLDSHHHAHHLDNRICDILVKVATEYDLAMRNNDDGMRDKLQKRGIPTPTHFVSSFFGSDSINRKTLEAFIESLPDGISEIMCHPGYVDQELRSKSSYTGSREVELKLLTDPEIFEMMKYYDVSLVSYRDILKKSK
jgi:chitin disaccharide deacetylase